MHLVIIGGSDAGISAARQARASDPDLDITVVVADAFPNFSICGLPFYLSGEVPDWRRLAHRTSADIAAEGIRLLLDQTARTIDPAARTVAVIAADGQTHTLTYDRLVIATGAAPVHPPITGLELPGVFFLHAMASSFAIERYLVEQQPQSVVIIGGGYIGLEMADALTLRGLHVTLAGRSATMLPTVDRELGHLVEDELRRHGVAVAGSVSVTAIETEGTHLVVSGANGFRTKADMVLVATGVQPASALAESAGVTTGRRGAIRINRRMETNIPGVYAAGDCVETWHRLLDHYTYLPLGTTAHKQGRTAGANAAGQPQTFAGSLGTQVVKVFELAIARTGLREQDAGAAGFDAVTVESTTFDHKHYYPGAQELRIRITGDRQTGRLLGAQILGHWQAQVAKRIDIFATALFHEMTVAQLNDLDLSYTPPLGSPWDAVQVAAQAWEQAVTKVR
jgi:NADPH-dependent 2,4-dienoyl-CoA reductase/sulfur reductase-like enzyme